MESYSKYLARGVNMTLATDTCPQSMIEALRWTAVISKIMDRRTEVATAADVFNSATLAGGKALGRDDLGKIAPGAKADLLFWEGASLFMTPMRDPVRNIVYSAQAEDLGHKLIEAFRSPFALHAQNCRVSATIGYALSPPIERDAGALLKAADAAMYAGKERGKDRLQPVPA